MNPQPYSTPPYLRPTTYDRCATCGDSWHGLPCVRIGCDCPTAWTDPEDVAS